MGKLTVSDDIRQAHTLPSSFYLDEALYARSLDLIFARSWQYTMDEDSVCEPRQVAPFSLLPGSLNEPLLLCRDEERCLHALSNVCTHRAKIVVEEAGRYRQLTCGYHGRCFGLDGRFRRMPAFEEAVDFPSEADHLPQLPVHTWAGLTFVALDPACTFDEWIGPVRDRTAFLPWEEGLRFIPEQSPTYEFEAHWALYVDNYLEGFHIPFVHPALNEALDVDQYGYEGYGWGNLQLGLADPGQPAMQPPKGHRDHGKAVYAYYFWLFPNLMLNVYPWGLSLNVVEPLGLSRTRVRFRTYLFRGAEAADREANQLEQTELEDERVVESVQRGIRSRMYRAGRFSPSMEQGVHHFHRILAEVMD